MNPSRLLVSAIAIGMLAGASPDTLRKAIDAPDRSPNLVARDQARHPYEILSFAGVKPSSTVVEIWPGSGYWTEMLAPYLHDEGVYYAALGGADGSQAEHFFARLPASLQAKITAEPQAFGHIKLTELSHDHLDIAPPGSADYVLTFRNLHNWVHDGDAKQVLAALAKALKPGGILVVEDHRARPDQPQDPKAKSGYVRQDYAVALIEAAGFKLEASSDIEANPKDTTDWPEGVWTLPPVLVLGKVDRAKYQAIGEADNFLLKFKKVGG